ncbi:MAG: DUF2461 domain-containing protein [Mucilaginibacter sp.]
MINQQTFNFLSELAENNNRDWFSANKERYDAARENVVEFTGALLKLMHKVDPDISPDLDAKKCVMRIYRDIRFSKNKTPYKNNFGISIPTSGSKLGGVEYYMHIQPDKSFIAGGYWMPETTHLKAIRQEIDYNAAELKSVIDDAGFVKLFGDFRNQDRLKTVPREYSADNENIDLLKLKSFIVSHQFGNNSLMKPDAAGQVAQICESIYPLNVFLKNALV